jgi:hypothetical protein
LKSGIPLTKRYLREISAPESGHIVVAAGPEDVEGQAVGVQAMHALDIELGNFGEAEGDPEWFHLWVAGGRAVAALRVEAIRSEFHTAVAVREDGAINLPASRILHAPRAKPRATITGAWTAPKHRRRLIMYRLILAAGEHGVGPGGFAWRLPLTDAGLGLATKMSGYLFDAVGDFDVVADGGGGLAEELRRDRRRLRANCRKGYWAG